MKTAWIEIDPDNVDKEPAGLRQTLPGWDTSLSGRATQQVRSGIIGAPSTERPCDRGPFARLSPTGGD